MSYLHLYVCMNTKFDDNVSAYYKQLKFYLELGHAFFCPQKWQQNEL